MHGMLVDFAVLNPPYWLSVTTNPVSLYGVPVSQLWQADGRHRVQLSARRS